MPAARPSPGAAQKSFHGPPGKPVGGPFFDPASFGLSRG